MNRLFLALLAALLPLLPITAARASDDLARGLDAYLSAHAEATGFMGAALVARGDQVILARGYGSADLEAGVPNEAATVFRLGSLTKQVTAAAVLRLHEQDALSVDDMLATHLPGYPNGERITLRQLLSHSAGIPNYTALPSFVDFTRDPYTTEELVALFRDLPLDFEPGSRFSYSNSGYVLLTAVVESVTGRTYGEYVQEAFFEPLGMTRTAYDDAREVVPDRATGYERDGPGYRNAAYVDMSVPSGAGALRSTVFDLLTWSRALAGGEVLGPEALRMMLEPSVAMDPSGRTSYGFGVMISDEGGHRTVSHSGGIHGFSTALATYPDDDVTVVVLSNVQGSPSPAIAADLAAIAFGGTVEAPRARTTVAVDPKVLEAYVGGYEIGPGMIIDVAAEEGALFVEIPGQGRYELLAEGENGFFVPELDVELSFSREGDAVARMVVIQGEQVMPARKVR